MKVLVIATVAEEALPWASHYHLTDALTVPGLNASAPTVACNSDDICVLTTGAGKANAAASVSAVLYSGVFDLSKTYFLIASVAGIINPSQGTVGSAAWASYVVDFALSWEIDARSIPASWTTGYLGIGASDPTKAPTIPYGTEHYTLASALVGKAVGLSKTATLEDSSAAQAYRALYSGTPATQPPQVLQCDTTSSDTVWGGALLGARAEAWVALLTSGQGKYCTTQQQDNALMAALTRGGGAGLLDSTRILALHTGALFDRQYAGQAAYDAVIGGSPAVLTVALDNLAIAGEPFVDDVVTHWSQWQQGVPQ